MKSHKIVEEIVNLAQLAIALEACSYPKPGAVHRFSDFKDTRLEHFIAGSIAVGPAMRKLAFKGLLVKNGKISLQHVCIGKHIMEAITSTRSLHSGGNTNLGVVTLLAPTIVSVAITGYGYQHKLDINFLSNNVKKVVKSTTVRDAINFYKAVREAKAGGLGRVVNCRIPDVGNPDSLKILQNRSITLYDVMRFCSKWDSICSEWVTGMQISSQIGYPTIKEVYNKTGDLNKAIVQCFLTILATRVDSLIARKNGLKTAKKVTEKAKKVLSVGGILTKNGINEIRRLDKELRTPDNRLNPGTTADLTVNSIFMSLLDNIRP
ncbi:MAG: triphosphoribosyl-dephospho-CoA synthase [Candidatus Bathyarchaeota archaeon]